MSPGQQYTTACCPIAAFATVGVCCAFIMGFWCRSIVFVADPTSPVLDDRDDLPNFIFNDLYFGPWYQTETEVTGIEGELGEGITFYTRSRCVDWRFDPDMDSKWVATRAFTVITVVLGGILGLLVCSTPFTTPLMVDLWRPIAICFIFVMTLFQGLTFLFLRSDACQDNPFINELNRIIWDEANLPDSVTFYDDECEIFSGMYASIAATVCWLCAGVGMIVLGPPIPLETSDKPPAEPEQPVETVEDS